MPSTSSPLRHPSGTALTLAALVACLACCSVQAQTADAASESSLPTVTVTVPPARSGQASITGFASTPSWQSPIQAQTITSAALKDGNVQRLADLTSLDASISDSYNSPGYWDFLSVRGFTLDNVFNYRREGLPINAETSIPLDNKEAVEVLKGTSGIQAGVSSPGGLVNFLVKRPQGRVRSATLAFTGGSSVLGAADLSDRFGVDHAIGLRINAAYEHLDPNEHHANGKRHLLALATDLRINPSNLVEFEIEHSRREQASVTAFSVLGDRVPAARAIDPDINLNYQPWSLPVVMAATTGTLRWTHQLASDWKLTSTYGIQRLVMDDRTVFAFGCSNSGTYLADRFCSDGSFDALQYDSENERRLTQAVNVNLQGQFKTGSIAHGLRVEAVRSTFRYDSSTAIFNYIGSGDISGNYGPFEQKLTRESRQHLRHNVSTELSVSDALTLSEKWRAWVGLRHSRLSRDTMVTDNSLPTVSSEQTFNTPWVALGYTLAPRHQAYISWGEGIESKNAPEQPPGITYTNSGQPLTVQKSRQLELGIKGQGNQLQWGLGAFQIHKPQDGLVPTGVTDVYSYTLDGQAVHTGLEGQIQTRLGAWELNGSAMLLDAKREHSAVAGLNGNRPVNVPDHTVKLSADYKVPALQGLTLQGQVVHEGRRMVLDDNSLSIPSWTRVDTGLRYVQGVGPQNSLTWRLGIRNLFDKRAWRESPKQFDHAYLFPLAGRMVTASVQADF